ncbi:MAG: SDR family NAD(P)-dependent oxidoreductase [Alphaproteobacteria bacterium]|nr:MAG: SDR family NAD(P)-dependent oxidoreductase [Alphaproteobacteria bacterium]
MNQSFSNQVALVTGGAKRIGRALCLALAARGCAVIVHYNTSRPDAEELIEEIGKKNGKAAMIAADLADPKSVQKLFGKARQKFGPITMLVNNAAMFERDTFADFTPETMQRHLNINTLAPMILMQEMAKQDIAFGAVVNLLDHSILKSPRGYTSYVVSKSALWSATQLAARQLAPKLRINAVAPGIILPPNAGKNDQSWRNDFSPSPLPHSESVDDVVNTCLHLLLNPALSGQMIAVDSGRHIDSAPIMSGRRAS